MATPAHTHDAIAPNYPGIPCKYCIPQVSCILTFFFIKSVSFNIPSDEQIPAKPPVIIAYPGLKIISQDAAIITPPARVPFIITTISSLPLIHLLIYPAVSDELVIAKNVLSAALC
jgi:hypothetical protein